MELKNYTKGNRYLIIWGLLAMVIIFSLFGCSARKVDKSKTVTNETAKVETTKIDSSKTVTVSDSNTKIVDTGTEEEFIISPIDSTKEMIVSGRKYFNVKISNKKVNNNKVVEKKQNVTETKQNDVREASNIETSKQQTVETKVSDKKQFNFLNLWWLLLLIPIYFLWKKYKGTIFPL